jgi:hypothetical protein
MVELKTSKVSAKPAPVITGLSRVNYGNHGNKSILIGQSCNSESYSWTHFYHISNGRRCNRGNQGMQFSIVKEYNRYSVVEQCTENRQFTTSSCPKCLLLLPTELRQNVL